MNEPSLFDRYRQEPTAEALVAVLRASQDRIYNLCLRILRQPQDAEDASQKVLLRILDVLKDLKDGDHYRRMVYRLAIQVGLDELRARSTRRAHERRKSQMQSDGSEGKTHRDVTPLYKHLARLDDRDRGLLVDHYLEGQSLEEIARTWGCSKVAIWKRLDKARAALRLSLTGAGLTALALGMDAPLRAGTFTAAPRDLVTAGIIEKAALVAGAPAEPTLLSLGGAIMAGKSASTAIGIGILLVAVLGGGALLHFRNAESPEVAPITAGKSSKLPVHEVLARPVASDADDGEKEAAAPPRNEREPLADRLKRFRDLVLAAQGAPEDLTKLYLQMSSESEKLRSEVLMDPAEYLAFLRARENEDALGELLNIAFSKYCYRLENGVLSWVSREEDPESTKVSQEILDGVLDLAKTGSATQKFTALQILAPRDPSGTVNRPLMDLCVGLLGDSDRSVAFSAFSSIQNGNPELLREHTDALARWLDNMNLWQAQGEDVSWEIRHCLSVLAAMDSANSDEILSKTLVRAFEKNDYMAIGLVDWAFGWHGRSLPVEVSERTASLLSSALRTASDPDAISTLLGFSYNFEPLIVSSIPESRSTLPLAPEVNLGSTLEKIREDERRVGKLHGGAGH